MRAGQVIAFAENSNFKAFVEGLNLLVLNAEEESKGKIWIAEAF